MEAETTVVVVVVIEVVSVWASLSGMVLMLFAFVSVVAWDSGLDVIVGGLSTGLQVC